MMNKAKAIGLYVALLAGVFLILTMFGGLETGVISIFRSLVQAVVGAVLVFVSLTMLGAFSEVKEDDGRTVDATTAVDGHSEVCRENRKRYDRLA